MWDEVAFTAVWRMTEEVLKICCIVYPISSLWSNGDMIQLCFTKYLLENEAKLQLNHNELTYLAGTMFSAGSITTASAISVAIMAVASFPATQTWVQEELDTIVGHKQVPTFDDNVNLLQVLAFVLESYRWRPVGGSVIGDHWSICCDPSVFANPELWNTLKVVPTGTGASHANLMISEDCKVPIDQQRIRGEGISITPEMFKTFRQCIRILEALKPRKHLLLCIIMSPLSRRRLGYMFVSHVIGTNLQQHQKNIKDIEIISLFISQLTLPYLLFALSLLLI
ncbi:cytochrome P450 [Armillaria gallica]|uniref:Cytochrome P450 n=1 Tax=Armillaria gallica TaxID=47427 RepID=A0A2H3CPB8_ARMGA|nr:cytochrome P450 [Armillaria gallica]